MAMLCASDSDISVNFFSLDKNLFNYYYCYYFKCRKYFKSINVGIESVLAIGCMHGQLLIKWLA
jgi:hypothetical protein